MTPRRDADIDGHRLPALDGVRAAGALLVWTAHGLAFPGGDLGVPVFFVLSGFLITTLLVHEFEATGSIRLRAFASRRLRRLYPALAAAVVLALVVTPTSVATPSQSWRAALHALTWTTNGAHDIRGPLVVAWSLSVEEQFYLVWPALLLLLLRRGRRRAAQRACAAGLVVCGGLLPLWHLHVGAVGSHLAGSAVALLAGCALALFDRRPPVPRGVGAAALAVLAALVVAVEGADDPVLVGGGYAVLAAAVAVLLAALVDHPGSRLARAFSVPSLVWFGRRSYGFYLYHLTIAVTIVQRPGLPLVVLVFSGLVLSTALAHLSYEHWERRWLAPSAGGRVLLGEGRPGAGRAVEVGVPGEAAVAAVAAVHRRAHRRR